MFMWENVSPTYKTKDRITDAAFALSCDAG
jgi:hypothetical protein